MVMVYLSGSISKCNPCIGKNASQCKIAHLTCLPSSAVCPRNLCVPLNIIVHNSAVPWVWPCLRRAHHVPQRVASSRWLCRSHDSVSPDDEYRSSRNIAISLFRRYRNVIDRGGGDNLKEFISAAVNAYALGCTDEGLRKELIDMKESGVEIEAMEKYGGSTSVKSKIIAKEIDECILWVSIIFITILCTPQPTVVRWSTTPPVSDQVMPRWKGFCAVIANAYYVKGMAWMPVKTLQLEQMAVVGYSEEPSVVASRMQLVFSTLEVVSPQWPKV